MQLVSMKFPVQIFFLVTKKNVNFVFKNYCQRSMIHVKRLMLPMNKCVHEELAIHFQEGRRLQHLVESAFQA
jgi:hypothetical protein